MHAVVVPDWDVNQAELIEYARKLIAGYGARCRNASS